MGRKMVTNRSKDAKDRVAREYVENGLRTVAIAELTGIPQNNVNDMLKARIAELESEVTRLRAKAALYDWYTKQIAGAMGEHLAAIWCSGKVISGNKGHDVVLPSGIRLEVKYSRVHYGSPRDIYWRWAKFTGGSVRPKEYDRIILIGGAEPETVALWKAGAGATHVVFDLSAESMRGIISDKPGRTAEAVRCNVRPVTQKRCARRAAIASHEVTIEELRRRYSRG